MRMQRRILPDIYDCAAFAASRGTFWTPVVDDDYVTTRRCDDCASLVNLVRSECVINKRWLEQGTTQIQEINDSEWKLRVTLDQDKSQLSFSLIGDARVALFQLRISSVLEYTGFVLPFLATCHPGSVHYTMSLRDISYLRYHFIHAAEPAESETVWACAEIVRVFPHSDNFEDLRGNEFPLRLHFSVRARECYTKYFAEKQEFRGDPIFSNGFAWYIAVRLTAGGLQFGFRALPFPYTAQSTFKRVHCSGIVKAGEFINLAVEEDVNFVGGNEFHPYQITDSSEFLTDGGTGIVSTVITITDATLQAERQSMPTRPQSNKKKDQDDMKEIMDRVIRPRMRDDGTVEFGSYVHFENPLGQGGFGADELPVAVKLMQYTGHTDLAAAEITILTDLTGVTPHLVSVFDIYLAPSQVYLVMELCNIGDLHYYIRCTTDKKLPEDTIRHFLKHMIEAMRVLRAKNIVHRDLKPQNLLLHDYNKTAHPSAHDLTLKVADFGLARYLADDSLAKSILGTRHYMAPEVAKAYWEGRPANYTPSVDLWAIGIILELSKVWTPKAVVAIVVKDYRRMDPGEINLNVGDLVTDIEQVNNGWWRGVCNGKFGTFPAKHVELRGRQN
ncbi:ULK/ULK protein kinase [Aphelenchoides avenae]|nr:ULK/ULK protein kinase [Aphelenchus avenae]